MLSKFRTYVLSVRLYHELHRLSLPAHLRRQLDRASSSVSLLLAEGYGRRSPADKRRFYQMSMGSLRECQAIMTLAQRKDPDLLDLADHIAASIYKLTR